MPLDPLTKRVQRRRKKGESLRQIAAATGVSKSTVARLVNGPKFKASLLKQQELIGLRRACNEEQLTVAIAKATDRCLAALRAGHHAHAGIYARAAKDLSQASREQGDCARMLLAKPLQEAEQANDPEMLDLEIQLAKMRRLKQLKGPVVEAGSLSEPPAQVHEPHF